MKQTRRCASCSLLLILVVVGTAGAEDWPMFRHDGKLTAATSEKLDPPLESIWVYRTRQWQHPPWLKGSRGMEHMPERARYEVSISAAGDALFFTSKADGRVVCLDAATGKMQWQFVTGAGVNRIPTYYEGKVYAGSDDGHVYCLDATTGKSVWVYKAAPADRWLFSYNQMMSVWTVRTNIYVDKGVAYFGGGTMPHDGTFITALNAETGKIVWKNDTRSETRFRWALSPHGNIYATKNSIYFPNDTKPFHWPLFNSFARTDAAHAAGDPEGPGFRGMIETIIGAVQGNVRYRGDSAEAITVEVDPKDKNRKKRTYSTIWKVETPGYGLDAGSILGTPEMRGATPIYNPDLCSVIATDGVVFSLRTRQEGDKAVEGKVFAHASKDGKELWSAEIGEWPNQVIAANGRLFVSTRDGTIYAFAPKGARKHGVIDEPVDARAFGDGPSLANAATEIVKQADIQEGYAVVLDCTTGELARELAARTKLHISAVFDDEAKAQAAREAASRASLHVSRIIVWTRKPGEPLPFPPRFADLVTSEAAAYGGDLPETRDALERLLKPVRGKAVIGGSHTEAALKDWIATTKQSGWKVAGAGGSRWALRTGPRLAGAGGWSTGLGDSGNTMCSNDEVLKPPLGVVWIGRPFSSRRSRGIKPAIMVDGVLVHHVTTVFDTIGHTEGYDQYTGRRLWRMKGGVTDTVGAHGAIIQRYFEILVQLDPWTGKVVRKIGVPFVGAKWTGMGVDRNGRTLYLVASGEGAEKQQLSCVIAYDIPSGRVMGKLGGPGETEQWGGWSAISDGRMYFAGGQPTDAERAEAKADMLAWLKTLPGDEYKQFAADIDGHSFTVLKALDAKTGKLLYRKAVDNTNAGGKWMRKVVSGGRRQYQPLLMGLVAANGGAVVFGTGAGADKSWAVWPSGGYKWRALSVYDGATGKLLWYRFGNYRARPVVTQDLVVAEPWAFHLRTGEPKTRIHPTSGKKVNWVYYRWNKQCGTFNGSRYFLFGRSRGIGYQDLLNDTGLYTILHSRSNCWIDTSSAGGTMIKPPYAIGCKCEVSMPFTFAMAQVTTPITLSQDFNQPGPALPVKHLYLDFGATGDRRDEQGRVWLAPRSKEPGGQLVLKYGTPFVGGTDIRRNSMYTPIENTDVPFVFATARRGLAKCTMPIGGGGKFKVRLGFSALPGDKPGRRVFDVKLNGETVLSNFDIVKETGRADRAVWKDFTLSLGKDLTLELVAKSANPTPDTMPLINALQVLRQ